MAEAEAMLIHTPPVPPMVVDSADVVFGLPGFTSSEASRTLLVNVAEAARLLGSSGVVLVPHAAGATGVGLPLMPFDSAASEANAPPWLRTFEQLRAVARAALKLRAKACVILGPDADRLLPPAISAFVDPVARGHSDLVMPRYPLRPAEGLLNRGIVYPLTRALYGKRVHFPLPLDTCFSQAMMVRTTEPGKNRGRVVGLPWLSVEATLGSLRISEVPLAVTHQPRTEGADLTSVLGSVLGPLFEDMELHASAWQRGRGSVNVDQYEGPPWPDLPSEAIEAGRMIDSFLLGTRNLHDIWSLVLPPVTLFELKKLSRLPAEQFRMPDALWVRIVYDFALAHRLRSINRSHLFGALTPLYLGWAASYALELGASTNAAADARTDKLATAFEAEKTYLVSRWRWPDRFNP